jgi:hypothetical protein
MYIQVGLTLGIVVGLGDGRLEIEG